jgi:uncharacterized LabA/DUF88 family protein
MIRVSSFVDGFNLYHALKRLNGPHLLWVDLWKLSEAQLAPRTQKLTATYYFSAFANWRPTGRARHREYVAALEWAGVTNVMGHFKVKDRKCPSCHHRWQGHEEKETDVNIALYLLNEAYKNTYDAALIISRDSDLKPAMAMVRQEFPDKQLIVVAPPHLGHSVDLLSAASSKKKITKSQIEKSLFPESILGRDGEVIATRPEKYAPPTETS